MSGYNTKAVNYISVFHGRHSIAPYPPITFLLNWQTDQFEKEANSKATVLLMDFAMGYECECQNEIQNALWSV